VIGKNCIKNVKSDTFIMAQRSVYSCAHFEELHMPNIFVTLPNGVFPADSQTLLIAEINRAAATAEQIPDRPVYRALCWVLVTEAGAGAWTCGGLDVTNQVLPCFATIYLPAGVLDEAARTQYIALMQTAFERALPNGERRQLLTSVVLQEVPDGSWGVNGAIWRLPEFARAAGFAHLQHLVTNRVAR
jgi:phenylpyruvate tautomerase PptA (4-oxalocrotonate tautomerase family)